MIFIFKITFCGDFVIFKITKLGDFAHLSVCEYVCIYIYIYIYFGEYVTPWTVHIFGKIADTTKANIYFIPSFRQYKLPTYTNSKLKCSVVIFENIFKNNNN